MEPLRQPIVLVDIDGDSIMLNGAVVERADQGDPWAAAIKAVAETVSSPLGRPVWALVSEPGGATKVAVHPDGSISHLEADEPVLALPPPAPEPAEDEEAVVEEGALAPVSKPEPEVVEEGALAPVSKPEPEPEPEPIAEPTHDELAAFLVRSAHAHTPTNRRPPEHPHRGPGREHPVARRVTPVLGVAALVMVALTAALLITMGDDLPMTTDEPVTQAADLKDVLPAANRVQLRERFPRNLEARVIPHAQSVAIRINASLLPVRARIVLNQVNGRRVERIVTLRTAVTRLHLEGLKPGMVDWVVRVAGARTVTGSVRVPEAPLPSDETTATVPSPRPPQDSEEPQEPTSTPPSDPLTPIDPDEPTGPIDPDDL